MLFKVKVYGRWTDKRQTKSDHKSSPCDFVTGELKRKRREHLSEHDLIILITFKMH
jgi:hypothetical protein